jgi:hypothetical protein
MPCDINCPPASVSIPRVGSVSISEQSGSESLDLEDPSREVESGHEREVDTDTDGYNSECHGEEDMDGKEEAVEDELQSVIQGKEEVRDWSTLRQKIKTDLKMNSKTLPLSQINQLMILSNFATLCLKGDSRIEASLAIARQWHKGEGIWLARRVRAIARHYQIFEQLPQEKRGGKDNAGSWLHDEAVQNGARNWLTAQPTGKVTPRAFRTVLNSTILPQLNISLRKPLSERTARRWLVKLGWRRTVVRKGVYMDGHEREDVVKYRREVFLPAMERFEARMARYEGPELKRIEPSLAPGEKQIIAQFHDECCFHQNDEARSAWSVYLLIFYIILMAQRQVTRWRAATEEEGTWAFDPCVRFHQ